MIKIHDKFVQTRPDQTRPDREKQKFFWNIIIETRNKDLIKDEKLNK